MLINTLAAAARPLRTFAIALFLVLAAMLVIFPPQHNGDSVEYTLVTVAIAGHGSPDIRYDDIAMARAQVPERAHVYDILERDMRAEKDDVYAAFVRGRGRAIYSVHFFGYPALAAIPYQLLPLVGLPAFKCYQVINLAAIFVLGLCLYRLFGTPLKAGFALALYMLCGGALYWSWSSPECLSAAALLSAIILYSTGAPLRAGLLAGLAAQQNPTILCFFGFAPLLQLCLLRQAGMAWGAALREALAPRLLLHMAPGLALFALPPLFNLWQFGVPNIIVKLFSNPALVSLTRLHSFFFDLNQGMLIGIPALVAVLCLWVWRGAGRRMLNVLALCAGFTLALALPTLAVLNWNSDAAGVMRYAFWSAMPLLFVLLWRLRQAERWPVGLCAALVLAQTGALVHASSYNYITFSPLAQLAMKHLPGWYNPEPEIFAERAQSSEEVMDPQRVYAYTADGITLKTMRHRANHATAICGAGQVEAHSGAPAMAPVASTRGWAYSNNAVRCLRPFSAEQAPSSDAPSVMLGHGWSIIEQGDNRPPGVWSDGTSSSLQISYARPGMYRQLVFRGNYFGSNQRTRVKINGVDAGWHTLQAGAAVPIPQAGTTDRLELELEHEAPQSPGPHDGRKLAFFLLGAKLQ